MQTPDGFTMVNGCHCDVLSPEKGTDTTKCLSAGDGGQGGECQRGGHPAAGGNAGERGSPRSHHCQNASSAAGLSLLMPFNYLLPLRLLLWLLSGRLHWIAVHENLQSLLEIHSCTEYLWLTGQ